MHLYLRIVLLGSGLLLMAPHSFSQAEIQNPNSAAGLFWKVNGNTITSGSNFLGTINNRTLRFRTDNQERMVIDSNGRVGIGIGLPLSRLNVSGAVSDTVLADFRHLPIYAEMMTLSSVRVKSGPAGFTTTLNSVNGLEVLNGYGTNTNISRGIRVVNTSSSGVNYGILNIARGGGIAVTDTTIGITSVASDGTLNIAMRGGAVTTGAANTQNIGVQSFASGAADNWAGYFGNNTIGDGLVFIKDALSIGAATPTAELYVGGLTANVVVDALGTGGGSVTATTATTDRLMYATTGGYVRAIPTGTTGQVLTHTASGPAWSAASANAWNLAGNSGTTAGTNFAGTTDNQDFVLKRNNTEGLRLTTGGALLATGNTVTGITPASGAGTRAMWIPQKQAFRAGIVSGTEWDAVNIGVGSAAFGANNIAAGTNSFAAGDGNIINALASNSIVMGLDNTANIGSSGNVVLGSNNTVTPTNSVAGAVAIGVANTVTGNHASAIGSSNEVYGDVAFATGLINDEFGDFGFISGRINTVRGDYGFAHGQYLTSRQHSTAMFGQYNDTTLGASNLTTWVTTDPLFVLGNGTAAVSRSNALVTLKNARTGINNIVPNTFLDVNGDLALRQYALTLSNGLNTAVNTTTNYASFYRVSGPTAPFSVGGITGGVNGRIITLQNATSFNLQVIHESLSATAANRIATGSGDTLFVQAGGTFTVQYSNTDSRWIVTASSDATYGSALAPTSWNLTGNSGTMDGTNFIGTTDNIPFTIRTNNQQSGRVDPLLSNAFLGYWAGRDFSTGTQNTAIGTNALLLNTTGARNTAIGTSALENNTGSNNIGIGYAALTNHTTGYSNVAVGTQALFSNTTKSNLVAIGDSALFNNGVGATLASQAVNNVAVGSKALFSTTTSSDNTAVGFEALQSVTTAFRNTAVGSKALKDNTGGGNTAVGTWTLENNTTGNSNTAMGIQTMQGNTTGSENVAMGLSVLVSNSTGNSNTGIGAYALNSTTNYGNTALGHKAGFTNNSGYRNTLLGDSADVLVNNLNAATAIGYLARVSASNTIILGDTVGRPQVGIGVTAVGKTLVGTRFEIASEGTLDNLLFRYQGPNDPTFTFQRSGGNLASPTSVFTVGGTLGRLDFWGHEGTDWDISARIAVEVDSTITPGIVPSRIVFYTQNGSGTLDDRLYINRSGNVGINNNLPAVKLHVDGGAAIAPRATTFTATTDNFPVTIDNESYIRINQTGGTLGTDRTVVLSNGLATGQLLYIECTAGSIEFLEGTSNVQCGAAVTMGVNDVAHFIWNGTDWLMVSFRAN